MTETTVARQNLITEKDYTPYCGNGISRHEKGGCDNPRTKWDGEQFFCPKCNWRSQFPIDFINRYKATWNK